MKLVKDKNAQLHTLEGLSAAILMLATLFFVTQGTTYITPQTEMSLDVQLMQFGHDALIVLDSEDPEDDILLKKYVLGWNGTEASFINPVPNSIDVNSSQFGTNGDNDLNHSLHELLPNNVVYNVDFVFYNETTQELNTSHIIMNGAPMDNSVGVSQLVTLHYNDLNDAPPYSVWNDIINTYELQVVEVRLILWFA